MEHLVEMDEARRMSVGVVRSGEELSAFLREADVRTAATSGHTPLRGDLAQVPPPGETLDSAVIKAPTRRGTTNGSARGSAADRKRRREWLVTTWRADVDALVVQLYHGPELITVALGAGQPCCRCYRCGCLLTVDTVSVDRVVPGCRGGTYARGNIRPSCLTCNAVTGGTQRRSPGKRKRS